jgi:hypothetical protein
VVNLDIAFANRAIDLLEVEFADYALDTVVLNATVAGG